MTEKHIFQFKKHLSDKNNKILRYFYYENSHKYFCRIFYILDGMWVHNKYGPASIVMDIKNGSISKSWFIFGKPFTKEEWENFKKELKR